MARVREATIMQLMDAITKRTQDEDAKGFVAPSTTIRHLEAQSDNSRIRNHVSVPVWCETLEPE